MENKPKISEAEWVVMEALWQRSQATANQIVTDLKDKTEWGEKTIRTLLNRLVHKKAVQYQKLSREYLYCPAVTRSQCVRVETLTFLQRVGRLGVAPFLAAFLEQHNLSEQELEELKGILDKKEENNASNG